MEHLTDNNRLESKVEVSIVIVNWNTRELLRQCLESIYQNINQPSFEVLVVDNGSTDGSAAMVLSNFPQVELIECKDNLGFVKANNLAVGHCRGEYIILLNSDSLVLEPGIRDLVNFTRLHPNAGAVGGMVLNPDRTIQYSCRKFINFWTSLIMHTVNLIKSFKDPISRKFNMIDFDHQSARKVDWVSGCYMLIPNEWIKRHGLFDDNIFMFSEDCDLCFRMRDEGYWVYYAPVSPIIHLGGQSTRNRIAKSIIFSFYGNKYFLKKAKGEWISEFYGYLVPKIWFGFYVFFMGLNFFLNHPKVSKKYMLFKDLRKEISLHKNKG